MWAQGMRIVARVIVVHGGLLAGLLGLAVANSNANAEPVKGHPRLLFRAEQIGDLRSRMSPTNEVWVAFKESIVDKALRAWKCSATQVYDAANGSWTRTSFTDETGKLHLPGDADWDSYSNSGERPAVPEDDDGAHTGNIRLFTEQYGMVFALMARLLKDLPGREAERAEYLTAARECLFTVIDPASQGHPGAAPYPPFRHPGFALQDRSFAAEAFPLMVDWIYEDLSAEELAKIRKTFLIWAADCNHHVYFAPAYPHLATNSPALLRLNEPYQAQTRAEARLALNNHWANHLREVGLYALALDPKDDVPTVDAFPAVGDAQSAGSLTGYVTGPGGAADWVFQNRGVLRDLTGVWLYLTDQAYRNDGAGGLSVEGTQYASNGLGPVALLMAALQSAGQDNAAVWGPQVSLEGHPFWSKAVPAYLSMLTPSPRTPSGEYSYLGQIFQPPLSGDLETYAMINDQFIKVLAPMGLADARAHGTTGAVVQAVRYIQRNLAQGGAAALPDRIRNTFSNKALRDAIYYFLLFDPKAPAAVDPRPAMQPGTFYASHAVNGKEMGMVLARSGSAPDSTYFHWRLDWNRIDHQRGDSLGFGLWKNGLWLTKVMAGYGTLQGCSDYRNSLSLQNGVPTSTPVGEDISAAHGSQWIYSPIGDPSIVARSLRTGFVYFTGDATPLYNHLSQETLREIEHASRSIVWLKPDHVVVYDRARSKQEGYYKRFWLNMPETPVIQGHVAHATAKEGAVAKAELFVSQLLPEGAVPQTTDIASGQPSGGEDMKARLFTEAPGNPRATRFLHVIQGADAGVVAPDAALAVASVGGTPFEGAVFAGTAVLFKKNLEDAVGSVTYHVPVSVTKQFITGLVPGAGYDVSAVDAAGDRAMTITAGGTGYLADSGGVLVLGNEPIAVSIATTESQAAEAGLKPGKVLISRSGSLTQALDVHYALGGTAVGGADYEVLPGVVTIPAGAASVEVVVQPKEDGEFEGTEAVTIALEAAQGYSVEESGASAMVTIADDDAPPGGYVAFTSTAISVSEAAASVVVGVERTGGTTGAASAVVSLSAGTAGAGDTEFGTRTVSWADGETGSRTVSFAVYDNAVYSGNRTALLQLSSVTGLAVVGQAESAVVMILEDEPAPPGQIVFGQANYSVAEGGGSLTIPVLRVGGTGSAVTVAVNVTGGSATQGADFTISPGELRWADGDDEAKSLVITLSDDAAYEGTGENILIGLSFVSGGASLGGISTAEVTILDDDPEPKQYDVGPGQSYQTIGSVPWKNLGPGSVVRIHHRAEPYHEKILVSGRGTEADPILVVGVPGANGEKPVIDGANATSSAALGYESWSYTPQMGIVAVARGAQTPSNLKPGHVIIDGLEVRGSLDQTYMDASGAAQDYWSSGGAIYLRGAEHVVVRNCELHHAPNGLVAECYSTESEVTRDLLVERCRFHDNSKESSWSGNNLQVEGVGVVVQFCRFEPNLNRAKTSNVRDRSAGAVYRYNWIEGGSYAMELIEPSGGIAIVTGDSGYAVTKVYGNVLVSADADSSSLVRFGVSYYGTENFRTNCQFHYNTVLFKTTSTSKAVFSLPAASVSVDARNNVFHSTAGQFQILSSEGAVSLGKNWAAQGWIGGWTGSVVGGANVVSGADPGFVDLAGFDLHPRADSPLRHIAPALPVGMDTPEFEYLGLADGQARASVEDLGAFGFAVPQPPLVPLLQWVSIQPMPGAAKVLLVCKTQPGATWALEATDDFVFWEQVAVVHADGAGNVVVEDPHAGITGGGLNGVMSVRFYRLRNGP